jgi:hypothetical protein
MRLFTRHLLGKKNMQRTILAAAFIMVIAMESTQAGLISSVVPSSETTVEATLSTVVDATTEVTAEATVGTTVETTPDATGESTSDSTATVWIPPPGLLSDETIASISAGLEADTVIGSVDVNADLNIGLTGNDTANRIPEPGTLLLVGIGLATLIATRRRTRKKQMISNSKNL